ncbi:MAG: hypothetical protein M3P98_00945 [bacterium]|nr:hypothetical protein [bacterium]
MEKKKNDSFWSKVNPNSPVKKLVLFVLIFAAIGGVWFVYQSFAFCGTTQWSGSCQAVVSDLSVKLDVNKNITNYDADGAGALILSDLGAQKRTQAVWSLGANEIWESQQFAFAENPERRRAACVELVSLAPETEVVSLEIAVSDNTKTGDDALIGLAVREGELEPMQVVSVCSEVIEGLPSLVENNDNWSIYLANRSETNVGLFRDYILLQSAN